MSSTWSVSRRLGLVLALAAAQSLASPAGAHVPIVPKKDGPARRIVHVPVPDLELVDQDGKPFRFASLRGKIVVVSFIFATCPDVCPLLTAKLAGIQRALGSSGGDAVRLLSITTDPERDTPELLKAYGANYRADFERWRFLTGNRAQLAATWKAFGVTVTRSAGGQIRHTAITSLIDERGIRRVDYYTDRWREKDVLGDISWLRSHRSR
ncbi:MAG TPA: SCO family protein [candidate division Zixibacteria bacterium]|nr:SCO family protein [candidate division Zixibacteria bacterium]